MGSLLFALYVNDIQHAMWAECVRSFAGDTVLFMVKTYLKVLISYVKEIINNFLDGVSVQNWQSVSTKRT